MFWKFFNFFNPSILNSNVSITQSDILQISCNQFLSYTSINFRSELINKVIFIFATFPSIRGCCEFVHQCLWKNITQTANKRMLRKGSELWFLEWYLRNSFWNYVRVELWNLFAVFFVARRFEIWWDTMTIWWQVN